MTAASLFSNMLLQYIKKRIIKKPRSSQAKVSSRFIEFKRFDPIFQPSYCSREVNLAPVFSFK